MLPVFNIYELISPLSLTCVPGIIVFVGCISVPLLPKSSISNPDAAVPSGFFRVTLIVEVVVPSAGIFVLEIVTTGIGLI